MNKFIMLALLIMSMGCQDQDNGPRGLASVKEVTQKPRSTEPASTPELEAELEQTQEQKEVSVADDFMGLLNEHRLRMGLKPLSYAKEIEITAQNHARRMARKFLPFGHLGSKMRCRSVLDALGLEDGTLCGENVATGQESAQEAFDAWMNSPEHREAIEDERYTHTGLGHYEDFRGKIYWAQIFVEVN